MDTAIYLRKSRAEEGDPDALQRHRVALFEYAKNNNLNIIEVYEEIVSGAELYSRPEMLRLLSDVEDLKYQAVLCMDIDRLGRGNMSTQGIILETLKAADCKIITPRHIYDLNNDVDELMSDFEALFARAEYKSIRRRMQNGAYSAAREGSHLSEVPFGFRRERKGKLSTLAIDETAANYVRMAFDMYVNQHIGCQTIAETFDALGAVPKKSAVWSKNTIRKMLKNPAYIGINQWNVTKSVKSPRTKTKKIIIRPKEDWIVTENAFPAIVDKDIFERAQQIFAGRYHSAYFTGEYKNPLAGLIYCGKCGGKLQRQHQPSKDNFPRLMCKTKGCCKSVSLELVEDAVIDIVKKKIDGNLLKPPKIKPLQEGHIVALQTELKKLSAQKNRLYDLLEQNVYTIQIFTERSNAIKQKEEKIKEALASIKAEQDNIVIFEKQVEKIRKVVSTYYDEPNVNKRNEMLRSIIDRIDYFREKDWKSKVFKVTVHLIGF